SGVCSDSRDFLPFQADYQLFPFLLSQFLQSIRLLQCFDCHTSGLGVSKGFRQQELRAVSTNEAEAEAAVCIAEADKPRHFSFGLTGRVLVTHCRDGYMSPQAYG